MSILDSLCPYLDCYFSGTRSGWQDVRSCPLEHLPKGTTTQELRQLQLATTEVWKGCHVLVSWNNAEKFWREIRREDKLTQ